MKTITKKRYKLNALSMAPHGDIKKIREDLNSIIGIHSRVSLHKYIKGEFQPSLGVATAVSEYFEKNYGIKENVWVEVQEPETINS